MQLTNLEVRRNCFMHLHLCAHTDTPQEQLGNIDRDRSRPQFELEGDMKRVLFSALLVLLVSVLGSQANAARVCKSTYFSAKNNFTAKSAAIQLAKTSWSAGVAGKYAPIWGNWSNAKSRTIKCKKKTFVLGNNTYTCEVKAKPCHY
jgi:hypothetical protein